MRKNHKRFLSFLLAFVMVIGLMPVSALATEARATSVIAYGSVRSDNSMVSLDDCLYTFDLRDDGKWYITSETRDGTPIYLDPHYRVANTNTAGYPGRTGEAAVTLEDGFGEHAVKLHDATGYLHVHTEKTASAATWNQCGSDEHNSRHDVLLYRPAAETETSSAEIPGYVLVEANVADGVVTGIEDGDEVLVIGVHEDGSRSVMHPSSSTSSKEDHIAVLVIEEISDGEDSEVDLGLTVTARYMTNRLSWNAKSGVTYGVERSEDNQSWQQIGTAATGTYLDETADMGTQYFYRVTTATTYTAGVQGAVTGMNALKQIAVLFYEGNDEIAFNGSNKVAIAEGDDAAELNALESGTIL